MPNRFAIEWEIAKAPNGTLYINSGSDTDGRADDLPEQAFLYVGSIDEVWEKAKGM